MSLTNKKMFKSFSEKNDTYKFKIRCTFNSQNSTRHTSSAQKCL